MFAASEHRQQLATFAVLLADGRKYVICDYSKDAAKKRVMKNTF